MSPRLVRVQRFDSIGPAESRRGGGNARAVVLSGFWSVKIARFNEHFLIPPQFSYSCPPTLPINSHVEPHQKHASGASERAADRLTRVRGFRRASELTLERGVSDRSDRIQPSTGEFAKGHAAGKRAPGCGKIFSRSRQAASIRGSEREWPPFAGAIESSKP